jgi:hypothetical protein
MWNFARVIEISLIIITCMINSLIVSVPVIPKPTGERTQTLIKQGKDYNVVFTSRFLVLGNVTAQILTILIFEYAIRMDMMRCGTVEF